jgi:hypothetical protein
LKPLNSELMNMKHIKMQRLSINVRDLEYIRRTEL